MILGFYLCRAQSYAERLRLGLAVIHGEAQCTEQDMDDGRHSPPTVKNTTVCTGLELPCMLLHFSIFVHSSLSRSKVELCINLISVIFVIYVKLSNIEFICFFTIFNLHVENGGLYD